MTVYVCADCENETDNPECRSCGGTLSLQVPEDTIIEARRAILDGNHFDVARLLDIIERFVAMTPEPPVVTHAEEWAAELIRRAAPTCNDPQPCGLHVAEVASRLLARAGHRTDDPHDCFTMNCRGMAGELESHRRWWQAHDCEAEVAEAIIAQDAT